MMMMITTMMMTLFENTTRATNFENWHHLCSCEQNDSKQLLCIFETSVKSIKRKFWTTGRFILNQFLDYSLLIIIRVQLSRDSSLKLIHTYIRFIYTRYRYHNLIVKPISMVAFFELFFCQNNIALFGIILATTVIF